MPQSFVLNLVTQSVVPQQHLQGYALQQLFFCLVETVDPALAHILRRDKHNRSYSLSAIQTAVLHKDTAAGTGLDAISSTQKPISANAAICLVPPPASSDRLQYSHHQSLASDTQCWWRLSFLDDELFDHLIFLWSQLQDESFQLGSGSVKITQVITELPEVDWASTCSYPDIYSQASDHERDIHLQFVTPTAFECDGHFTPLPTAEVVFHLLRKSWNRYGGLVFSPHLISHLLPIHFDIQTEEIQSARRHSFQSLVGCTGQISFRIVGDRDPLTIKRLNALADFARYCSIGCNAQLGMGIVHRIQGRKALIEPARIIN